MERNNNLFKETVDTGYYFYTGGLGLKNYSSIFLIRQIEATNLLKTTMEINSYSTTVQEGFQEYKDNYIDKYKHHEPSNLLDYYMKISREKEIIFFRKIMGKEIEKYDQADLYDITKDYYKTQPKNGTNDKTPFYYSFLRCFADKILGGNNNNQDTSTNKLITFLKEITTRTFYDKGLKLMSNSVAFKIKNKIISNDIKGIVFTEENKIKQKISEPIKSRDQIKKLSKEIVDIFIDTKNIKSQKKQKKITNLIEKITKIILKYFSEGILYEVGSPNNFLNTSQVESLLQEEKIEEYAKKEFSDILLNLFIQHPKGNNLEDTLSFIEGDKNAAQVYVAIKNLDKDQGYRRTTIQHYKGQKYSFAFNEKIIKDINSKKESNFLLSPQQINNMTEEILIAIQTFFENENKKSEKIEIKIDKIQDCFKTFETFMMSNLSEDGKEIFQAIWKSNLKESGLKKEIEYIVNQFLEKRLLPFINLFFERLADEDKIIFDPKKPYKDKDDKEEIQQIRLMLKLILIDMYEKSGEIEYKEIKAKVDDPNLQEIINNIVDAKWLNDKIFTKEQKKMDSALAQLMSTDGGRTSGKNLITDFMSKFYGSIGEIIFSLLFGKIFGITNVELLGNARNLSNKEAHTDLSVKYSKKSSGIGFQSKQLLTKLNFSNFKNLGTLYPNEQMQLSRSFEELRRYEPESNSFSLNIHALRQLALFNYSGILLDQDYSFYALAAARIVDFSSGYPKNYFYIGNGFLYPVSYLIQFNKNELIKKREGVFSGGKTNKNYIITDNPKNILSKSYFKIKFELYAPPWNEYGI